MHYIGTSWRVPDTLALRFARTFYESLLQPGENGQRINVGAAVCNGREGLFYSRGSDHAATTPEEWSAWAAYQHYGDPSDTLASAVPRGRIEMDRT